MIRLMRPPARTSSSSTSVFSANVAMTSSVPCRLATPWYGNTSTTSPMCMFETSISIGSAPESSMVLKKIGAILPPTHRPPVRLFGTFGMSSPMNHSTEFVADLREDPVPTTSPTYAIWWPFCFSASICAGASVMPSRGFLSIASACRGMSGRDHASGAGLKSSVLVSPVTLNVVKVIFSGTSGRLVNHSASAQLRITRSACVFPARAFASTSWNASNIRSVFDSSSAAPSARSSTSSALIRGAMLYPPCMVPRMSTAFRLDTRGEETVPSSTAVSQLALTYAASSTPGGTRFSNKSISAASSPFGGFSSCSTREATCFASKGLGAMFSAARSATCASYSVRNVDAAREESAAQGEERGGVQRARAEPTARGGERRSARGRGHGRDQGGDPSDAPETPTLAQGRASRRRTARPLRSIVAAVGLGRDTTGEGKRDGQSRVLDARSAAAPRGRTPPEL